MGIALAVELVHASSLILDDLPSMDNSLVRRGRPACHVRFGEATALLASFALLARAFQTLTASYEPVLATQLTTLISETVGTSGLIAGTGRRPARHLARHHLRTARAHPPAQDRRALHGGRRRRCRGRGRAAKDRRRRWRTTRRTSDSRSRSWMTCSTSPAPRKRPANRCWRMPKKTTFVSFSGIEGARALARELCDTADRALTPFGSRADALRELTAFVASRRQ